MSKFGALAAQLGVGGGSGAGAAGAKSGSGNAETAKPPAASASTSSVDSRMETIVEASIDTPEDPAKHQQRRSSNDSTSVKQELMRVTQQLLDAIAIGDFDSYSKLCDAAMTCFEPEALGNLIQGMEFHKFYFDNNTRSNTKQVHTTMLNPQVHMLGDEAACVCYVRLVQYIDRNGETHTRQSQESRIWHKRSSRGWVCVHTHRTQAPSNF